MRVFSRAKEFSAERLPWDVLRRAIGPALEATVADATAGAIAAALARGLEFDPEVIAEAVAELLPGYAAEWEAAVIRTSQDRVSAAVARYTAGDISLEALMESVDTVFDPARAELFAVNETTHLYDIVNQIIDEQAGVEKVRWLTVRDFAVCEECSPLDNQVFDLDDAPHPIDDTHYGCRCFLAAEVPEASSRDSVTVAA